MNSVDLIIGSKTYELYLTSRATVQLENDLGGRNVMAIFLNAGEGRLPTLEEELKILFWSLRKNHRNEFPKFNTIYNLYDEYLEDGGDANELLTILVKVLQVSGIMPKENLDGSDQVQKVDEEEEME